MGEKRIGAEAAKLGCLAGIGAKQLAFRRQNAVTDSVDEESACAVQGLNGVLEVGLTGSGAGDAGSFQCS